MPKGGECPRYIESYPFIPIDVPCRKGQWWAAYVWKTSPRIQEQLYFVRFGCGGFTLGSCCVTYAADCSKQVPSNSQCCWCSKYKAMSIQGRYSSSLNRKEMIRKDRTYWIPELSNSSEQRIGSPKGIIYCTSTKIPRKVMCRIGAFGPICLMGECRALPREKSSRLHLDLPKNVIQEASKRLKLPETEGNWMDFSTQKLLCRYRLPRRIRMAQQRGILQFEVRLYCNFDIFLCHRKSWSLECCSNDAQNYGKTVGVIRW